MSHPSQDPGLANRVQRNALKARIAGTGRALPATCVTSRDLDARLGLPGGALESATGVLARHVCAADESQIDLAVSACQAALADAGIAPSAVDLVLSGCSVPYQPLPATAPLVMRRLGIAEGAAAAFDINSTCLSFLTAFEVAGRLIDAGQHRAALVFSSEIASRALPWQTQPEVAALFGDGAAAAVLTGSADGTGQVRAALMRTWPSAWEACAIGAGGTRFDFRREPEAFARHAVFGMDGKALFRLASRHFSGFADELLARAGWRRDDVDVVVPHQASPFALAHMARQTGFAPAKLVDISARHGNQIAASLPFALDIARRDGRIAAGSRVLLLGTSAGVSFGGMALEI
jgi:3-oxoacyl-[acyl-carrier-protein] synthase-3